MTTYIVHIYREMRLRFDGIEADSPQEAAELARDLPHDFADDLSDCDGETFAAQVDALEDEEFAQSRTVEFEAERMRKAAPGVLDAAKLVLSRWESGDLARAVRELAEAVKLAGPDGGKPTETANPANTEDR